MAKVSTARTLSAVIMWYTASIGLIMYNKWMLSYLKGFRFPISLMLIHQGSCSVLSSIAIHLFGAVTPLNLTWKEIFVNVFPVAFIFSFSIALVNEGQMRLPVSFIQMLKASIPFWTCIITLVMRIEAVSWKVMLNCVWIGFGVIIAAKGELEFEWFGCLITLAGIICECIRLVLSQKLLQGAAIKFNPLTGVYYTAPLSFMTLLVPWFFIESEKFIPYLMSPADDGHRNMLTYITPYVLSNGCMAFVLNLVVYNFIQCTDAITTGVAGKAKDVLNVIFSTVIFHNVISNLQIGGYSIALSGVCYFTYLKIMKQRKADKKAKAHSLV
jgi:hypothetical protein